LRKLKMIMSKQIQQPASAEELIILNERIGEAERTEDVEHCDSTTKKQKKARVSTFR
jgi:hypothetical protein